MTASATLFQHLLDHHDRSQSRCRARGTLAGNADLAFATTDVVIAAETGRRSLLSLHSLSLSFFSRAVVVYM
eukprot:4976895-Prymnesium_polylepis.1